MIESETKHSSGPKPWIREGELHYSNPLGRFSPDPLRKGATVLSWIFISTGALMLAFGYVSFLKTRDFLATSTVTVATVSRVEQVVSKSNIRKAKNQPQTYSYLSFSDASGQIQQVRAKKQAVVGQQFDIRYLPGNPRDVLFEDENPWMLTIVAALIGGVELMFGLPWLALTLRRRGAALHLIRHGMKVEAQVTEIKKRTWRKHSNSKPSITILTTTASQYSTNRVQSDFALQAEWKDPKSGNIFTFMSSQVPFEPAPDLVGKKVEVFVDPDNPQNYYFGSDSVAKIS